MLEDRVIIRASWLKQFLYVLLLGVVLFVNYVVPDSSAKENFAKRPIFGLLIFFILLSLLIYFLFEIVKRRPEIVITAQGLELRNSGYFEWESILSFETIQYRFSESNNEALILHLDGMKEVEHDISILEINRYELVDLLLKYKGSFQVVFDGHNTK